MQHKMKHKSDYMSSTNATNAAILISKKNLQAPIYSTVSQTEKRAKLKVLTWIDSNFSFA